MQKTKRSYFELGESNIFEEFYELIEDYRTKNFSNFSINKLYENLYHFDLAYQKFNSHNSNKTNKIVYNYINSCLSNFLIIFRFAGFSDRPIYWSLIKFIQFSTFLLKHSNGISNSDFFFRNISKNFQSLINNDLSEVRKYNDYNYAFENLSNVIRQSEYLISSEFGYHSGIFPTKLSYEFVSDETLYFKAYCSDYRVFDLILFEGKTEFEKVGISYEMEIRLQISVKDDDASKLTQSLFLIISSLSNIENVDVKFETLEVGSLITTFRVFMENLFAKKQVQAVLETATEGVVKTITAGQVSHSETRKNSAETKKTSKETDLLDLELKSKPTETEAKIYNTLNLEKLALENEEKRINNAKGKLELIEKVSELTEKGILEADSIQIDINGVLYFLKNEEQQVYLSDNSIDEIS